MNRTDSVASYGRLSTGSSRTSRRAPIAVIASLIATVLLVPATAVAAEPTTGYSQTTPPPTATTTTPATTPTTGTSPSKEEQTTPEKTTPTGETSPTSTTSTSTTSGKATTLPFTGFDLRWVIVAGLLLVSAGFSLVVVERRQRRKSTR